ncbi:iron acquisition yersiniabactin synthesis enzyme domain protein [Yersinia pestis PY-47]|nr:iron acquisition yersiniabactin synthesis enzyme domain protein [Yersinia pestis PY-47]
MNSNASSATPTAPRWYLPAIWGVPSTAAAQNRRWASRNGASRKRRRSG